MIAGVGTLSIIVIVVLLLVFLMDSTDQYIIKNRDLKDVLDSILPKYPEHKHNLEVMYKDHYEFVKSCHYLNHARNCGRGKRQYNQEATEEYENAKKDVSDHYDIMISYVLDMHWKIRELNDNFTEEDLCYFLVSVICASIESQVRTNVSLSDLLDYGKAKVYQPNPISL